MQDFARRGESAMIATFRVQDYSWDDHAFSLINRLYNDVGNLIDEKFRTTYHMTYYTMGSRTDVDTSRFRRAIWNYIQWFVVSLYRYCLVLIDSFSSFLSSMFGIRHDDYDYGEVNQLLERSLKSYVKSVVCFPERVTPRDYDAILKEFRHSEKVRSPFFPFFFFFSFFLSRRSPLAGRSLAELLLFTQQQINRLFSFSSSTCWMGSNRVVVVVAVVNATIDPREPDAAGSADPGRAALLAARHHALHDVEPRGPRPPNPSITPGNHIDDDDNNNNNNNNHQAKKKMHRFVTRLLFKGRGKEWFLECFLFISCCCFLENGFR